MNYKLILFLSNILFTCQVVLAQDKDTSLILGCIPKKDMLDDQKVFRLVEKNIEFKGGEEAMYKYISNQIHYPAQGIQKEVIVYVTFIVDTAGRMRNECVLKSQAPEDIAPLTAEALRIVRSMPPWIPAESKGKKVYSRKHLPIKFEKK